MDIVFLIAIIVLLYALQTLFTKLYTDNCPSDADMASSVFTVASGSAVVVVTFCIFSFCRFTFNPWCILIGAINAVALFSYNFCLVKASKTGPYSIVMIFMMAGGIILPIITSLAAGWDSWSTPFEMILNALAVLLIFVSVYLVSDKQTDGDDVQNSKITMPFLMACIGIALANGVYSIILTLQQRTAAAGGEGNRDEMIITTYFFALILSIAYGLIKKRRKYFSAFRQNRKSFIFLLTASVIVATAINLTVIIIPLIPSTLFYTLDNSLVLIISAIFGAVFFKERLSKKNIIGVVLMCVALIAMNLLPAIVPKTWVG